MIDDAKGLSMPRTGRRLPRRTLLRNAAIAGPAAAVLAGCGLRPSRGPQAQAPASSAGTGSSGGSPQPGGTFNTWLASNPPSLDPHRTTSSANGAVGAVMSLLFRFQVNRDPRITLNHDLENELALSAESPDAVTWTIKLRPDAKFHNVPPVNGHSVEAEDIKATFTRALTLPQNPSRGALGFIDPAQIQTPAPDTVVFRLKYAYAPLPNILASPGYSLIFPREVQADGYDATKRVIGSGPFVFDSYQPDVSLILKKNPAWFESGRPYLDGVRVAVIPDPAQRMAQFTAGNLDTIDVQESDLGSFQQANTGKQAITTPTGTPSILYLQLGDPASPFQDIRMRRALSLAIDRDALGKAVWNNHYQLGLYVNISLGKWALTLDQTPASVQQYYKLDLAQAKKLVEEAGGTNLNLRIVYPANYAGGPHHQVVTEAINNMLQALPWKLSFGSIDYNNDYVGGGKGYLYGNFPSNTIISNGISPYTETDQFLFGYYDSQSTSNQERVKDPTLDAMIEKARTVVDAEERRKAYIGVQQYLAEKMYTVAGLPVGNQYTYVQPWAHDYFAGLPSQGYEEAIWSRLWLKR